MGHITLITGSQGAGTRTSEPSSRQDGTTLNYHHPVGTRARDASGNEYIYVEFGATVKSGTVVGITSDRLACVTLVATHRGAVGVVMGSATSDQAGWVQIYGSNSRVQVSAGATSSAFFSVATSVSTPATGVIATTSAVSDQSDFVYGMWPTGVDVTSTETSAGSLGSYVGSHIPAYLNYPYVLGVAHTVVGSSS